jgi:hypothetical protein
MPVMDGFDFVDRLRRVAETTTLLGYWRVACVLICGNMHTFFRTWLVIMLKTLIELKARLRYLIDRAFAREFAGQLLLFFVLVVTVTLIGMTAVFFGLFSEENANISGIPHNIDKGFWDSLWWSLNQVLRLRGFERMYGASAVLLAYAFFLSLMGLVVFSVLISLINNTMRSRIEALRSGETPVLERGHVLVLGWNNKVYSVLRQLASLEPGLKAVILAPREINVMQEKLRVAGIAREPITVILRSGIPSNRSELQRVALDHASSVIMLSTGADDSESIKSMVLLAAKDDWPGKAPTLTSEIAHERNYELARIASRDRLQIVSSAKVISKVIVQAIRNPGLSSIYNELFSHAGNSIYVQQVPECSDVAIENIAYRIADAIPVGITWAKQQDGNIRHAAALNPEPDYEIAEDEKLVLLARGLPVHYVASESGCQSKVAREGGGHTRVPRRILLIGWSDMIHDILLELNAHALQGSEISILAGKTAEQAGKLIEEHQDEALQNLSLDFIEGDAAEAAVYSHIDLGSYQSIVVLADDWDDKGDVDTRTLRILLRLSELRKYDKAPAHTVVELMDEANRDLIVGLGVDDVVISPNVVSAQLAQIARQDVLGPIYRELLSAGGVEISLRPAGDYVALETDCHYNDLIYAAQQKLEIALGLRLAGNKGEVLLNPPRDKTWRLAEDDQVIVLAQQLYQ